MPTYEYVCTSCGRHLDVVQRFSDEPLEKCEVCGGKIRRVFHPVGVMFKGSGFYSTDSRTSKRSKTSDAAKPDGKPSKPEAKPDAKSAANPASSSEAPPR